MTHGSAHILKPGQEKERTGRLQHIHRQ